MAHKPLVIITGASSGIGAAIAQCFSAAGYPLGLMARNLAAMQKLNLPNSILQSVDVVDVEALKIAVQTAEEKFGATDCLINNAGYVKAGDFTEIAHVDNETMVNVNLLGVINGIEVVLPGMQQRKAGTIINMSSIADRKARPHIATYAATKAAVRSLTESLRVANAKYGIRFCNIAPAKIETPMLIKAHLQDAQSLKATDLAKAVLWLYEQPQTTCIRDFVFAPTGYEL